MFANAFSWSRVGLIAILIAALLLGATRLDWGLIFHHVTSASLPMLVAMAMVWAVGLFIRSLRMFVLARALLPVPWRHYWTIWTADVLAMVANSIVPMRAGDALVPFMLRRALGTRAVRLFPIVLVDRFFDFVTVAAIFVAALAAAPAVVPWGESVVFVLVGGLMLLVFCLWFTIHKRTLWVALLDRVSNRSLGRGEDGWAAKVQDLIGGFAVVDSLRVVAPAILLSIGVWTMTSVSYWLGSIAIFPATSPAAAAFAASVVALSFVVPLTPAGIGVFHAAMVLALSVYGMPAEIALAVAIVVHGVLLCTFFALAIIAVIAQRIDLQSLTLLRDGQIR
jgi:uncharacterized protein (TIRG00374 family)